MELRPLGSTGLAVSILGLGLVKLGRTAGLKHPGAWDLPDDAAATLLLETARTLGINLLDTAPAYGVSEERLGALLASGVAGGRDGFIISTKAGEEFDANLGSRHDFSPAALTASVERSLRRLRTDRLDIVLLHIGPDDRATLARGEALETLARLKAQGKIRAIGASTKTVEGAIEAMDRGADALMVTYNPRDTAEAPAIDEAARRGVGILLKKALLSGHLGSVSSPTTPTEDPVTTCMRFALAGDRGGAVSSIITGTINPAHLRHNARAAAAAIAMSRDPSGRTPKHGTGAGEQRGEAT